MNKAVIVLAMHGAPPADFPRPEFTEFMSLHGRIGHSHGAVDEPSRLRYVALEKKMRAWPRSAQNDPFFVGSQELAGRLSRETGLDVILGFNEFCAPSLDEALDRAAATEAPTIVVVTPMMTPGGEHSEADIPAAIERAKTRHPGKKIVYAWPFAAEDIARFLASHLKKYL
jgi:sirohydrochlorin cobaltochelatase